MSVCRQVSHNNTMLFEFGLNYQHDFAMTAVHDMEKIIVEMLALFPIPTVNMLTYIA